MKEKIREMDGYTLHLLQTEKYKTNTIVWKMKAPLNEHDLSYRALLPYVLQANSKTYPTSQTLRTYLDDLYGANLFVDLAKKGNYHIITFTVEVANEKFLTEQSSLLEQSLHFLSEILINPNVRNEAFDSATVEKEKRTLKQRIQSIYDDKMKYASVRLVDEMCKGEKYALHVHGTTHQVEEITPETLYQYYVKACQEDELDLYLIGDISEEMVDKAVKGAFSFSPRQPQIADDDKNTDQRDVQVINEVQDVLQGKLNIGFRTNIQYGDEDYFALQVMNGLYGGFSHSKLFINVREKESLAYYAASRIESHKGLMMVMAGIEHANYKRAVAIIKEQMDAMKAGDFTEQEFLQTKAVIRNQLLETADSARGVIEILYHNVIIHNEISLDDWLTRIEETTKEEVVAVCNKIDLDTIYFLTGTEEAK